MVNENATTNHIENEAEIIDTDDLEVSAQAVMVSKNSPLTPLVDVEWAHPRKKLAIAVFCIFSNTWT